QISGFLHLLPRERHRLSAEAVIAYADAVGDPLRRAHFRRHHAYEKDAKSRKAEYGENNIERVISFRAAGRQRKGERDSRGGNRKGDRQSRDPQRALPPLKEIDDGGRCVRSLYSSRRSGGVIFHTVSSLLFRGAHRTHRD